MTRRICYLPFRNCCLAAATTWSGVKPNFSCKAFSGADAPKVCMPMICPLRPDVPLPAKGRGLLHRDARGDIWREDTLTIFLTLVLKQLPRRHAHHPRVNPFRSQLLVGMNTQRHLTAGGEQEDLRFAVRRVGEHIRALGQT